MLVRFDSAHTLKGRLSACVTPYLYGRPWLEKPALYYWRAMFLFQDFGVHDWSARLPSTTFAFIMVGAHLPAHATIPSRRPPGRSSDYRRLRRHHGLRPRRFDGYADGRPPGYRAARLVCMVRNRLQVLALRHLFFHRPRHARQGPRRATSRCLIIAAFAFLRKEWGITFVLSGGPASCSTSPWCLPWFIAVQHQNQTFFREFFLEHNLERFATDRYQHSQPPWYYIVVILLAPCRGRWLRCAP